MTSLLFSRQVILARHLMPDAPDVKTISIHVLIMRFD